MGSGTHLEIHKKTKVNTIRETLRPHTAIYPVLGGYEEGYKCY